MPVDFQPDPPKKLDFQPLDFQPGAEFNATYGLTSSGPESSPGARFAQGVATSLNPIPAVGLAARTLKRVLKPTADPNAERAKAREELYQTFVQPQVNQFRKAGEQARQGNLTGATAYGAAGAFPILGPTVASMGERVREGDVAGPLGEAAGMALPTGLRLGIKAGASRVAKPLYTGALNFPKLTSLEERAAARDLGLAQGITVSKKGLSQAGDYIKARMNEVSRAIADARAAGHADVDLNTIVKPVDDIINEFGKTLMPEEATAAAMEVRRQILAPFGNQRPTRIPIEQAQEAKQLTYRMLRKAYGEEKSPRVEAAKAGVRGTKEAIEAEAPAVRTPNRLAASALDLEQAIEERLKSSPQWLHDLTPWLLGGGAGGVMLGHPEYAGMAVAGAIAREAIRNPAVMSRLAVALSRTGSGTLSRAGATFPTISGPININQAYRDQE